MKANNETTMDLILRDFYVVDPVRNSGYYGVIKYTVEPRRRGKFIRSSSFAEKFMEQKKAQQIHVINGDKILLVLHQEDFEIGKDVFFGIAAADGLLVARFVEPAESTVAQRVWGMFGFRGAGS
ncbi:hypothetical protein ABFS82_01G043400 [Erythranthe guttata]|uniref:uncharacterized protein LOC105975375 n=1 Tax=Erythranthe guttata TaxID=4155 RepID=UPI00064DBA4E|nr:PREDICTED: uncharacterized protein LOC105975375 [Erythranthe guttata]|eukprot:XP_012856024.1 PREDICTED: uncharacterized protein LOC105975375 [Erythranthe guttata]